MTYRTPLFGLVAACALAAGGCQLHSRATEPGIDLPPPAADGQPYHVSGMRVQTVRDMPFIYASMQCCFNDMFEPATQTAITLKRLVSTGQIRPDGPILFVYHDPSEDASAMFDLEIGVPVRGVIPPPAGFKARTLPVFRCATMIYRGPLRLLPKAYDKLIPEMIAAGFVPSTETRESYLVWENPDSGNNVVQIEVGIR